MRKQSLFLSTTSVTSRDLSWVPSFSRPHGVSLFGNSGAMSVQWSDVEHALCSFSGVCWDYFHVFCQFGVPNESTVKSGIFPCRRFETHFFFILSQVQREGFHYDKAISCKCYVQLLIQDVYSILSKTCQLWVNAFWRLFSGVARIFC